MRPVATTSRAVRAENLLQEGVASASAVLFAISAGGLLTELPAEDYARCNHTHATQLLAMLEDSLREIQRQVDELDPASPNGGR